MDMNASQRIEASREKVYAALNDVEVLKQCIPGCESIEKISDNEMTAKVTLRVGPVKASFNGKVTLSDLDPPNGYTIVGEGTGGMAGFAKGGATVKLEADGDATILHYTVKAEVGGKLAQLGGRLIDATATKLAGEFFEKFSNIVGPVAPANEEEPSEKKGWLRKITGALSVLVFSLLVGAHWCCIGGHIHGQDDPLMSSICSSRI
ncbi:carbon monoxide dehydrogenase subunit G [[Pseudomonas] carboxydohydrogena]|uniref:Carbon monoxide dehydrogenase subunit G n=1 Tax=Afipia carboxydohydrogena TaxID=290 RepID=A0ABY8BU44_AFICR|nr:carbon monoxide dehydrogenase subunit G [[Pseudomonas] carboxydohydrogena]WEF52185.1 carbon monoxide dehydrogenase subunit G [[Pseudomonas] carboxydohydrogena]